MVTTNQTPEPEAPCFALKDCALIAIATNKRATTLKEFRDHIENLEPDSLYYHFWADLLLPHFEEREYINDFASWVRHSLHDAQLAEQLAVLDPTACGDLETLRHQLLERIDDRLEESAYLQWSRASQRFEFVRSQIVVFDTHTEVAEPSGMTALIHDMSVSSMFYHFIDARRRTEDGTDDFRQWLGFFGPAYQPLTDQLAAIDPYFSSLPEIRQQVAISFENFFAGQPS